MDKNMSKLNFSTFSPSLKKQRQNTHTHTHLPTPPHTKMRQNLKSPWLSLESSLYISKFSHVWYLYFSHYISSNTARSPPISSYLKKRKSRHWKLIYLANRGIEQLNRPYVAIINGWSDLKLNPILFISFVVPRAGC